jgi:hypothetical protein
MTCQGNLSGEGETMNLIDLANILNKGHFGHEDAHTVLSSLESKTAFAVCQVQAEQSVFAVPDNEVHSLAAKFADPITRKDAIKALGAFGFQPGIDWAGTSISIQLANVFADEEADGETFVVTIPQHWSCDLWGSDRDLTDEGYVYSHWVSSTLPSVMADDEDETPTKHVLLSNKVYGTLFWGGIVISLYRGEVQMEAEHSALSSLANA